MEIKSAICLIENLIFKPEWSFEVDDHTNRFEGCVKMKVNYPARNSNRDQAESGYPQEINTYATFPMLVGDCDSDLVLYRRVANALVDIEAHEIREFLRVPGTNWAPFHPHRMRGMAAWRDTESAACQAYLAGDLQFGVA